MAEKRTVGAVTAASTTGAGAGYAAATIIVWIISLFGLDATPIEDALGLVLTVGGGLLGGYLVPSGGGRRAADG